MSYERNSKRKRSDEHVGYSDHNNRFGDSNLTTKFDWKLKNRKLNKLGIDPGDVSKEEEEFRKNEIAVCGLKCFEWLWIV